MDEIREKIAEILYRQIERLDKAAQETDDLEKVLQCATAISSIAFELNSYIGGKVQGVR